jgi:hypothetical protein
VLRFLERLPQHVLTVVDEAYFEYVDDSGLPDAIEEAAKQGRMCSPADVLEDLRSRRAAHRVRRRPREVDRGDAQGAARVRRDDAGPGGGLASLDGELELARRRAVNREAMAALETVLRAHGFEPIAPAVGNFLYVDVGEDAEALNDALLRRGVIVRPMGSFGAPTALRISAGTPAEIAFLAEQLASSSRRRKPANLATGRLPYPFGRRRPPPMRTTLKRGVGRGATSNGSNRATVLPARSARHGLPSAAAPPRRAGSLVLAILGWAALVLCVLVGGTAGGAYLYLHESVAAVAPKSKEVKGAEVAGRRAAGQPADALVIGYDHRANEGKNSPSRSDTLMLVRADPDTKTISLLSFPAT